MNKSINKIKAWIHSKRIIHADMPSTIVSPTVQEDVRDIETRKRVAAAFEAQANQIHMRAMKQHSCDDPMSCTKRICFKFVPDKIIATKIMTKEEVDKELGR